MAHNELNAVVMQDGTILLEWLSVAGFIKEYSPEVHLAGRIYFHLVENKNSEAPFAFLATYSTRLNNEGESRHLPLKYALEEYGGDSEKLLELLVTVHDAAEQSELVDDLLESGELFSPLPWSAKEACTFFREIPLYEEAGILCRIPNWWKGKTAKVGINYQHWGQSAVHGWFKGSA